MAKIKKSEFEVLACKKLNNSVSIGYWDKDMAKEVTILDNHRSPHPDMEIICAKLKEHVAKIFCYDGSLDNINITGFKLTKDEHDEVKKFMVNATMRFLNGKVAAINTPMIDVKSDVWNFEDGMLSVIDEWIGELYEFTFNAKQAQVEMDFEEDVENLD